MAGNWAEADRLRAEIESAGWRVTDRGVDFGLVPAHPPDVVADGQVRYGSSGTVPSRLDEPDSVLATVIVRAADTAIARTLASIRTALPAEAQVVVVADDPGPEVAAELATAGLGVAADAEEHDARWEVAWTSARLGPGAALNIGLRLARGACLICLDPGTALGGEGLAELVVAAALPDVAAAGGVGLAGTHVRGLEPAGPGDVAALDGRCVAVPRSLAAARGPVDERFATWRALAVWWTLVLRDEGVDRPPRRAIALDSVPLLGANEATTGPAADTDRLVRRDRYRLLERFGERPDLFVAGRPG
jgi:hypothetical protein